MSPMNGKWFRENVLNILYNQIKKPESPDLKVIKRKSRSLGEIAPNIEQGKQMDKFIPVIIENNSENQSIFTKGKNYIEIIAEEDSDELLNYQTYDNVDVVS